MRAVSSGWRTAGSRARVLGTPAGARQAPPAGEAYPPHQGASDDIAQGMPWSGVSWSLALIGLLAYIWTVTTYSVPIGQQSMIVALIGLLFLREPLRVPPFLLLFGAFLAWAFVGSFGSAYPEPVAARLEVLWKVGLIALVVANALRDRATVRVFMFVFLAAYALYPVRGTIFNYLGGYTLFGRALWNHAFSNPNDLAAMTLLQLSLALALFVREPRGWPKLAALAGIVLLPIVILLTQSRGAIIALAAFGLLVVMGQKRRARAFVGVAIVSLVGAVAAPESLWIRLGGLAGVMDTENLGAVDEEGSAEQRYEIWRVARAVAADHPIMGVGAGAYSTAHGVYTATGSFARTAGGQRDAHSTYLSVLAETGAVGLTLFALLLASALLHAERVRRRVRDALPRSAQQLFFLELGILAFLLAGVFGSYAGIALLYVHVALLWCTAEAIARDAGPLALPRS